MRIESTYSGYTAFADNGTPILSVTTYETSVPTTKYQDDDELCTLDGITTFDCELELELQALKAIFGKIFDEFGRYPGIDNHFNILDATERRLISLLISRGDIPGTLLLNQEDDMARLAQNKDAVQNLINATTTSRGGNTYSGFIPHNTTIKTRPPRSFARERTPQLLRQMATQLYHFCCAANLKPTEIQIMYLKGSLFISANSKECVNAMRVLLNDKSAMQNALTTAYNYKGLNDFDKQLSIRHANKINDRVYGTHRFAESRFLNIVKLLTQDIKVVCLELPKMPIEDEVNLYFVCDHRKSDRHAEENLADILEHVGFDAIDSKAPTAIFGKKRPCFTCHARLKDISERWHEEFSLHSQPFEFNPYKGLLFKNAAYKQNHMAIQATAASLGAYNNEVYISKEGDSGYATVSNSEWEDEEEISLPMTKLKIKD